MKRPLQLKVLMVASEAVPYAKTGGLADVTGTMMDALADAGVQPRLFMPLYRGIKRNFKLKDTGTAFSVTLADSTYPARVLSHEDRVFFIENDEFYARKELYGTASGEYSDNAHRFIFFSRAVLKACAEMGYAPDVVHTHDWQTALIPLYIKTGLAGRAPFKGTPTVFTIHNLGYQGIFPASAMPLTGLGAKWFTPGGIEFYGQVNLLKAGIVAADAVTTVSENYASEILTPKYGSGLQGTLSTRKGKITGILNGLDYDEWDPSRDTAIAARYSEDSPGGKARCKRALVQECAFERKGAPIAGMVGRLSAQKGIDIATEAAAQMLGAGLNLVVLGKGEEPLQKGLRALAKKYPGRVFVKAGYDEAMARRIYAGADMLLMPSSYEPCGLVQMIAMRYGTVPVARATGGLADTIEDYDHLRGKGTGFLFSGYNASALAECSKRALGVYADKPKWQALIGACMKQRFLWSASARRYTELYRGLRG